MRRFFDEGDKVKVTLRFRGREMAHQEIGLRLLFKVRDEVTDTAKVESDPSLEDVFIELMARSKDNFQ